MVAPALRVGVACCASLGGSYVVLVGVRGMVASATMPRWSGVWVGLLGDGIHKGAA